MSGGSRVYARLKADAQAAGIGRRSYAFYALLATVAFSGYAAATAGIILLDSFLPLLLSCLAFSFFTVQLAGIMHDCGHRAVFASARNNDRLGFVAGAAVGMILNSWRAHHNRHHAFPNQHGKDPDFQVPLTAFTVEQVLQKSRFVRSLAKFQAFYFYAILATASLSNRLGGITYFLRRPRRGSAAEFLVYVPVVVAVTIGPFLLFPLEKAVFVFVAVHLTSGLYLANCFAPNHKGMITLPGHTQMSFFEQQVVTARNISGGRVADVLMVGLNNQIEHHLFPSTPRNKLHLLREPVKAACEEEGIPYLETSFAAGGYAILRSLHEVSRGPRVGDPASRAQPPS